jgi:hypothetical protein
VAQILGAAEHRSEAYWAYVERGAQAATTEMGRMGAEDPSSWSGATSLSQCLEGDRQRFLRRG